nr:MAG TPA: hypothetical protein [Caudoviricetes sp.]
MQKNANHSLDYILYYSILWVLEERKNTHGKQI